MGAQLVTAVGAFVGTVLGIWIQRSAAAGATEVEADLVAGLLNSRSPSLRRIAPARRTDRDAFALPCPAESHGLLGTSATPADLLIPAVAGSFLYVRRRPSASLELDPSTLTPPPSLPRP